MSRKSLTVVAILLLAGMYVLGVAGLVQSRYVLGILSTAAALSVIALGVWLTFCIGRVNLGQGAFALLGGYSVAILWAHWGVSFWISLPVAGILSAAFGALLGLGILRLRGVYFAMISLSLTEATRLAFLNGGDFTGGASGISGIPVPGELSIAGITLIPSFAEGNSHLAFFYLSAALLVFSLLLCWRLTSSRIGAVFLSMQQSEELAQSLGINVTKYRVLAYSIACFLGGIGGAYFAVAQQSVFSGSFGVADSVNFVLYCFVGGLGFLMGPLVGAYLLFLGFQLLQEYQQYQQLFYSSAMIMIMLWLPNGLLSIGGLMRGRLAVIRHNYSKGHRDEAS